jgi:solute:Na+ symporter, SSS family
MTWIDWVLVGLFLAMVVGAVALTQRCVKGVADFLAANRSAGRYLLCVADGMAGFGAITMVALFEMYYNAGFTGNWWGQMMAPVSLLIALSGWVVYRYRETRALTLAQFFEARYSRRVRIFSGFLAWISGVVNFGIFPAVGARFLTTFCHMPETVWGISTYMLVMFGMVAAALGMVVVGGQVSVMVADFIQGVFTNLVMVLLLGYFVFLLDWDSVVAVLKQAPEGASKLHPFQAQSVEGFNFFYFLIGSIGAVYGFRAWQGNQGYYCAARNPHEAKMAGILGEWRGLVLGMVVLFVPVSCYVIMNHPEHTGVAVAVQERLTGLDGEAVRNQMRVPLVLAEVLPVGLMGLFAALIISSFVGNCNTYLHSWGSIFVQDVLMPIYGKPFAPRTHMWLLRGSIACVAVFILLFSLLFRQTEFIFFFLSITGAIYIGGAGSLIIGGLYWSRGSNWGAWGALLCGGLCACFGIVLQQVWPDHLHPALLAAFPGILEGLEQALAVVRNAVPGIDWKVTPEKFPISSQWMFFFTMAFSIGAYIGFSLLEGTLTGRKPANLDRLLHRGKYSDGVEAKRAAGWRSILPTGEFTGGDKVIYWGKFAWSTTWLVVFVVGTIVNFVMEVSEDSWAAYWRFYLLLIGVAGTATTVWFLIGGIRDMRALIKDLKSGLSNSEDDGFVK